MGGTPTNWSGVIKLLASDAAVPSGAPGYYVGRQTGRDATGAVTFSAAQGDVFCVTGWATTVNSTVTHRIGLEFALSSGSRSWPGAAISVPSGIGVWQKASGCFTAPATTVTAKLWTQNDGTNGTTASAAWYQTAITITKQ